MNKVWKTMLLIMFSIILSVFAFGCSKVQTANSDEVRKYSDAAAESILTAMNEGNFSKFSEDFDSKMKEALNEQKFNELAAKIKNGVGEYKSKEFVKAEKVDQYTRAIYNVQFETEKNAVPVTVVFSKQDDKMLVSGLFFSSQKIK